MPRSPRALLALLALGSAVAFGGCGPAAPLRATDWTCTWVSADGRTIVPPADAAPTLRIEPPADAAGHGGVNRFAGPAQMQAGEPGAEGAIAFPAIAATKMAGPPERMELERTYFAALRAAKRYAIAGRELELRGDGGPVARFRAAPAVTGRDAAEK